MQFNSKTWLRVFLALACAIGIGAAAMALPAHETSAAEEFNVTFTKWITVFPNMAGTIGGDVAGSYHGKITNTPDLTAPVTTIEALYTFNTGGPRSFTAQLTVTQDNVRGTATLTGSVIEGWNRGARVTGEYRVISPCAQAAPGNRCFQGSLKIAVP